MSLILSIIESTECWGGLLTLGAFGLGVIVQKKTGRSWCNPMLICSCCVILFLSATGVSYSSYKSSTSIISYLLLPATVCLAIPLYEQYEILKKNFFAVFLGILSGVVTSLGSVIALAWLLKLDRVQSASLMPKSVTTAIGIEISEKLGGIVPLSASIIIMTGMAGYLMAEFVFKVFKITDPLAKGVALGTSCHALGTAKGLEMGKVEGAMSSLSIAVAGILTAVLAPIVSNFLP